MAPAAKQMFNKDERVLCFHGPMMYEAKVLETQSFPGDNGKEQWEYRVHYKGWKNT